MTYRRTIGNLLTRIRWKSSSAYWERRYATGGNSGAGSYGANAQYKADIINRMITEQGINTVIELGCGDGNQLKYATYPSYLGLDVSETAVKECIETFAEDKSKSFMFYRSNLFVDNGNWLHADAALSLDVIFHLVEDTVFDQYLNQLFSMGERQVIIFSSNRDDLPTAPQERHRRFTDWITTNRPDWDLVEHIGPEGGMVQEFFRYAQLPVKAGARTAPTDPS